MERFTSRVAVYLILHKDNEILLLLRDNTGFMDGRYSLVAGHVEAGETPSEAMIREAKEEANLDIQPEDLIPAMISYRNTPDNPTYVDFYFHCSHWQGEIHNNEPDKCAELKFFAQDSLPDNMVGYVRNVINHLDKTTYLELHSDDEIIA